MAAVLTIRTRIQLGLTLAGALAGAVLGAGVALGSTDAFLLLATLGLVLATASSARRYRGPGGAIWPV